MSRIKRHSRFHSALFSSVVLLAMPLALTVGLTACAAPAQAQLKTINTLLDTALKEYERGNYLVSLKVSERALEAVNEAKMGPLAVATATLNVAGNQSALGQYKEAEANYKIVLSLVEKNNLMRAPVTLLTFNDYGAMAQTLGRYEEAEALYSKSIKLGSTFYGPGSLQNALAVNNLAAVYLNWGRLDQAQTLVNQSIQIARASKGKKSVAGPYSLCNQAKLSELKGDYKKAHSLYGQALADATTIYGGKHPYVSMIYKHGLAPVAVKSYDYDTAEKYLQESLNIDETTFGKDSLPYQGTEVAMASVEDSQGKYEKALERVQNALDIYNKILGDRQTVDSTLAIFTLGTIETHLGNYDKATQYLDKALESTKAILGPNHIKVANILKEQARLQSDRAEHKKSVALIEEALDLAKQSTASDNPDYIEIQKSAGYIYQRAGDNKKAIDILTEALANASRVFDGQAPIILSLNRELAQIEKDSNKLDSAETRLLSVIGSVEKEEGKESAKLIGDLTALMQVERLLGKNAEAEALAKRISQLTAALPAGSGVSSESGTASNSNNAGNSGANSPTETSKNTQESGSGPQLSTSTKDNAKNYPVTDKWALVIGISSFKDPEINLKFAAKDASDFANFLTSKAGFSKDHVRLLLNGQATREGIIQNLGTKWLGHLAAPDDLVVVYVSSHGSGAQEEADKINFLVAHDTDKNSLLSTGIPMQWFSKMIAEQVHAKRVVLILDVCHSAAASGAKSLSRQKASMSPEAFSIGEGQLVICSSAKDQVSWESKNYQNSVFTKNLIDAFATGKENLPTAFDKLKNNVQIEVLRDRSSLQTPIMWSKEWRGNPPVLSVQPTSPRQGQ